MKVLLSILPIALFVFGCGNTESKPNLTNTAPEKDPMESAVEWSKLQNRNGDAYIPNTDKPYSGWAKQNYDNEQVKVLAEFTDGSVTRLRQWQENGIPMLDIPYLKGKVSLSDVPLEGYWASDSSLQHGPMTVWHENGQKWGEENYKDGKLHGRRTDWYENGQKEAEVNYKDGKEDGPYISWHENGQKWREENYKDGKLHGRRTDWYENGQKEAEVNYKDGKVDGLFNSWYENGQNHSEENFKNGKLVTANAWKLNGEKCPITNVVEGNGVIMRYCMDGTMCKRETYKDGWLVEAVSYREDGTVSERETYKKGELVEFVSYREDGTVGERKTYKDGERVKD
jgi:antitoxin component YwqK of YwqJK toxin-antitoxin module